MVVGAMVRAGVVMVALQAALADERKNKASLFAEHAGLEVTLRKAKAAPPGEEATAAGVGVGAPRAAAQAAPETTFLATQC